MSAAYRGLQLPIKRGLQVEAQYALQCLRSPQTRARLRTLSFLDEIHRGKTRPPGPPPHRVAKVAVLGAGMMGGGIAYACSKAGMEVVLKDLDLATARAGKSYSEKVLAKGVKRGRFTEDRAAAQLDRIHPTDQPADLAGCDLAIEAVTEDRKIKEKVIREMENFLPPDALLSSNTSTLPITGLARYSKRPEHFVGLHFFSPVDKMPLVEIIRGEKSSEQAVARAFDFVRALDKTPIIVNDGWGFYTSRVFSVYVNEGLHCLNEGIHPALIENAGTMAGMPVGPLAVADEVGLDLMGHIIQQKERDIGSTDHSPPAKWIRFFVHDLKRPGRKSGAGFYEYPKSGGKHLWPQLSQHLRERQPDVGQVKKRLLYAQALEAARVLQEGVLTSPLDGDIGSIMGWGFAPHTGGVFSFIDQVGTATLATECATMGEHFQVPPILQQNKGFYS